MTTVLGVDGGQSGTRMHHSGGGREVDVQGVGRLEIDTVAAVEAAVVAGWRQGGYEGVDRVVLGLTTVPVEPADTERLCRLVAEVTGAAEVWLTESAVTSHAGALSLGWGVSLVAGTGAACLALPARGEPRLIGGHGYLLGDEGGAFWIGRRALEGVLRSAESRGLAGDPAALAGAAERRFGPLEDLHVRLYGLDRPVHAIAEFARDVCAAADAGDVAAHAILREAAAELVLLAAAAVRAAGPDGPVPLALGGRLLGEGSALRRELDHALSRSHLNVVLRSADADGAEGAVMLGLRDDPGRYAILVHRWPEGRTA